MADSVFNYEIERFITPIRGLYKEYIISIEDLREKNPELFENNIVDTASVRDGHLIYQLYGNGEEGEIVKEQVQTWICDNRQDVTRAVGITLRAKETSFSSWFRSSEDNRSPDELIVYCLSKMSQKHTAILNKSFAWSTLSNYIKYSDVEIVQRSSVVLIYVGLSKYAVLKPSWTVKTPETPMSTTNSSKTRKRKAVAKTTCRSGSKRTKKETVTPAAPNVDNGTQPVRRARTLAEKRSNQYGIKGGELASTRTTRKRHVDYLKLNDGFGELDDEPISPKPKKKWNYLPSRSGPSSTRQRAQTTVTSPPSRILPCIPAKKTIQQSKRVLNSDGAESSLPAESTPSGVQISLTNSSTATPTRDASTDPVSGVQSTVPVPGVQSTSIANTNTIAGVQLLSSASVSGVQSSVSGVQHNPITSVNSPARIQPPLSDPVSGVHAAATSVTIHAEVHASSSGVQPVSNGINSAEITPNLDDVPANDDKLPELVRTSQTETDSYSLVLDTVPPVGDLPPDNIFDGGTTEEELDAVDALLSLSNVRDNAVETPLDDNASLMPIGGNSIYQDVNLVTVHLDQVSVDGAIAKIVSEESVSEAVDNVETEKEPLLGDSAVAGQDVTVECEDVERSESNIASVSGIQNMLSGVQTSSSGVQDDDNNHKDDEPPAEDNKESSGVTKTKGYVKVTTHGIRKNTNSDNRSYHCSVCGIRKRSAHNLNVHHRKRHSAQMCGVCGKFFDLASSLSHHMYTHDERRFFCEKCSFHCHFKSELKKHNISHHSQPSHQCMKRNCGRWFKRKVDLVLHVETHKKEVLECDVCDFTTTLQKYLKEHKKSHENTLPYSCDICGKRFLWRSGVRAHKIKEHSDPKP